MRLVRFEHEYNVWFDNAPFIDHWNISHEMGLEFNDAGQRKERWVFVGANVDVKSQSGLFYGGLLVNQELFRGIYFPHIERSMVEVWSNPVNEVRTSAHAQIGKFIYRDDVPELGTGHTLNLSATLKPTARLLVDLSYSRARLKILPGNHCCTTATYCVSIPPTNSAVNYSFG